MLPNHSSTGHSIKYFQSFDKLDKYYDLVTNFNRRELNPIDIALNHNNLRNYLTLIQPIVKKGGKSNY